MQIGYRLLSGGWARGQMDGRKTWVKELLTAKMYLLVH
jgi:hypothetical protein